MARVQQFICDYCNEVVGGYDKQSVVRKDYVQVKGSLVIEYWDEAQDRRGFVYTEGREVRELTFCHPKNKSCMVDYILMKEKAWFDNHPNGAPPEPEWEPAIDDRSERELGRDSYFEGRDPIRPHDWRPGKG